MRRRWHLTAMVAVVGLIGLPVVPVPAGLLGIAPIQPSLPGEIDPIPRQPFGTAASETAGAATFGSPVIITGDDTGEPGIDIAQDGTIYVNAPAGFLSSLPGSASFVYHLTHQIPAGLVVSKSVDGGVSFLLRTVAATPADQMGCICPPGTLISERGIGLLGLGDKVGFVYATSNGGVRFARSTSGGLL